MVKKKKDDPPEQEPYVQTKVTRTDVKERKESNKDTEFTCVKMSFNSLVGNNYLNGGIQDIVLNVNQICLLSYQLLNYHFIRARTFTQEAVTQQNHKHGLYFGAYRNKKIGCYHSQARCTRRVQINETDVFQDIQNVQDQVLQVANENHVSQGMRHTTDTQKNQKSIKARKHTYT